MGHRLILGLDLCWVSSHTLSTVIKPYLHRGRKFCPSSPGPMVQEYGGFSKINDVVGVLLDFKDGVGSLSFYNNGVRFTVLIEFLSNIWEQLLITFLQGHTTLQYACITVKYRLL